MKRTADQQLTEQVIKTPEKQEQEKQDTPQQIAQRRILKIKATPAETKKATTEPSKEQPQGLKLIAPLTTNQDSNKTETQKPLFSGGLFGSSTQSLFTSQQSQGLFANLQPKPVEGNIAAGGLFPNTNKGGLFGNTSGGLFGNNSNNNNNNSGGGLFGSLPEGWLKSGPQKDNDNEEDDEEGSDLEQDQKSEGNPEESKFNYEYQQDFDKIINITINKFRLNEQDPALQGFISIEKLRDNQNQYIVVYRNSTKLIQHQGLILKLSVFSKLNKREDCLQMTSYSMIEEEPKKGDNNDNEDKKETATTPKKKLQRNILKIMFKTKEDCEKFSDSLKEILDNLQKSEK